MLKLRINHSQKWFIRNKGLYFWGIGEPRCRGGSRGQVPWPTIKYQIRRIDCWDRFFFFVRPLPTCHPPPPNRPPANYYFPSSGPWGQGLWSFPWAI